MQGSIFTAFADMIIDEMGMEQWNELITQTRPASAGIYTNGAQYEDSELINMVVLLAEHTGQPIPILLEHFGHYLFTSLYNNSPADLSTIDNLRDFLLAIDSVIHVEVKRLSPSAYLPKFEYADGDNNELILYYHSKRKLCYTSIGLIKGAAEKFNEKISISHPECMHFGADKCKLIIEFTG